MTLSNVARLSGALAVVTFVGLASVAAAQGSGPDRVRAIIAGEEIRQSDVDAFIGQLPEQVRAAPREQIDPLVVNELVNTRLVVKLARAAGTEQDETYKLQVETASLRILQNVYLSSQIEAGVTDERLQKLYEEFVAANPPAEQIRASHILVEAKEAAQAIAAEVRGGADFAEVARRESTGPSASAGGDLGFFEKGQMVATFSEVAFALELNETSDPVQTQFGWHVIKLTDRRQAPPPALDEVREELTQQLTNDIVQEVLVRAREGVTIETFDVDGNRIEN
ncbi:MAG: peptidylprolyl isomerase [Proteobacteria bacterium]|nr:peptidylprolyl isomerase [Pseudomonadota bacterium]MDA1057473.1 peptidylprolyl isomerase [Pseudomonadota bacterium]